MKEKKLENIQILECNHIEGTPFTAVKTTENENYFVVAGKTRILTECKSLEEVIEQYQKPTFENIALLIESILNIYKNGRN